ELKNETSAGDITLDPDEMLKFKNWHLERVGYTFVLKGYSPVRVDPERPHYRAAPTWRRLTQWLRSKGVNPKDNKPVHYLRKAFGARVTQLHDIHAACVGLRHSRIRTTAAHYAPKRTTVTVGWSHLSSERPKVVDFPEKEIAS